MISTQKDVIKLNLVNHIREFVRRSPLEILARSAQQFSVADEVQKDLFSSYAEFLEILDDRKSREHLRLLRAENSRNDATFKRIRRISYIFEKALDKMFFDNPKIGPLTRKYGVF